MSQTNTAINSPVKFCVFVVSNTAKSIANAANIVKAGVNLTFDPLSVLFDLSYSKLDPLLSLLMRYNFGL